MDTRRLNRMHLLAAMGRVTADLGHELRNPLAVLQQYLEQLDEFLPPAGKRDPMLEETRSGISRKCVALTDTLNQFQALLGEMGLRPEAVDGGNGGEPVPFARIVAGMIEQLRLEGLECQLQGEAPDLAWPYAPELPAIVFMGCLRDAAGTGTLCFSLGHACDKTFDRIHLDVSGVTREAGGMVFAPMSRNPAAAQRLDLLVAQQVARRMEGELSVEPLQAVNGIRYTLHLPPIQLSVRDPYQRRPQTGAGGGSVQPIMARTPGSRLKLMFTRYAQLG